MLTEERYSMIVEQVKQKKSITLTELCELLGASESTVRRDLTSLDEKGLIKKVHGGAISVDDRSFNIVEHDVESKSKMFTEEKRRLQGLPHRWWTMAISFSSMPAQPLKR